MTEQPWTTETGSASETYDLGIRFARRLTGDEIVLLYGDLGSGKTVFTQGVARGLGVEAEVQSPTYTLIHEYHAPARVRDRVAQPMLVHIDLYRLSTKEVESTGVDELMAGPGVKIVEWADRLAWRPGGSWMVTIEQTGPDGRRIRIRREQG